jgi:hypothetical protein
MKIELKKLKINLAFSEETTMFMADVYVDGVCVAYAQNDGRGGSTYYHAYEGMCELLKKAEEHCEAMPPIKYHSLTIDMNLEHYIDELVTAKANEKDLAKFKKKLAKDMLTKVVWGVPNSDTYKSWGFKGLTIEQLLATPKGTEALEGLVKKVKAEMEKGEVIFNENVKEKFGV